MAEQEVTWRKAPQRRRMYVFGQVIMNLMVILPFFLMQGDHSLGEVVGWIMTDVCLCHYQCKCAPFLLSEMLIISTN